MVWSPKTVVARLGLTTATAPLTAGTSRDSIASRFSQAEHFRGLSDPLNTILIAGYQSTETLGRRLVDRRPEVRVRGQLCPVKAEVVVLNSLSSHTDMATYSGCSARWSRAPGCG